MMKKIYLTLITVLLIIPFTYAQWAPSGNNIYNSNSGKVGIGTTNPTTLLSLLGGSINLGSSQGQYTLSAIDNSSTTPLATGTNLFGLFSGDLMLRSFWGVSVDINDGALGDNASAAYARIPNTSSFTINSRSSSTAFTTLFTVRNNGTVGIGTTAPPPGYLLAINGSAIATSVTVQVFANWPDYVFKPKYHLPTLTEVKTYIDQNQHLPEIPSAAQIEKDGLNIGDMDKMLVKKVEELTLYLIEKDKQLIDYKNKLNNQQKTNQTQQHEIDELKKQVSELLKRSK